LNTCKKCDRFMVSKRYRSNSSNVQNAFYNFLGTWNACIGWL